MKNLSTASICELRDTLVEEIGVSRTSRFSDEELEKIGLFLLEIVAQKIKMQTHC